MNTKFNDAAYTSIGFSVDHQFQGLRSYTEIGAGGGGDWPE